MVLPPRGPDGMIPAGPPTRLPVIQPPSLCEAGPCRNYHRVTSVMDAEDGGHALAVHRQTSRACYPTPGIEVELGETPVLTCSRWEPDSEQARLDSIRIGFMKSADGKAFVEKMQAFEDDQARLDDEADLPPITRLESLRTPEQQAQLDAVLAENEEIDSLDDEGISHL